MWHIAYCYHQGPVLAMTLELPPMIHGRVIPTPFTVLHSHMAQGHW